MGRQGKKKRKPVHHLPKVTGDPGELWSSEPTPWVVGGESAQRWVGRAGPSAQAAYFRHHRGARIGMRVAGVVVGAIAVAAVVAMVLQ